MWLPHLYLRLRQPVRGAHSPVPYKGTTHFTTVTHHRVIRAGHSPLAIGMPRDRVDTAVVALQSGFQCKPRHPRAAACDIVHETRRGVLEVVDRPVGHSTLGIVVCRACADRFGATSIEPALAPTQRS